MNTLSDARPYDFRTMTPQELRAMMDDNSGYINALHFTTAHDGDVQEYIFDTPDGAPHMIIVIAGGSWEGHANPSKAKTVDELITLARSASLKYANTDARKLARYFSALLNAALSPAKMSAIVKANANRSDGTCATHDYTDSNAMMYGAFCALYFREPDPASEADANLMDEAWTIAKVNGFQVS